MLVTSRQHGERAVAYSFHQRQLICKVSEVMEIALKEKKFNRQNKMLQENSLCSNGFHVHKVHAEIFQFISFSNSKMKASVLSTCTA